MIISAYNGEINSLMNEFLRSYVIDNKQVLKYLDNIGIEGGNFFDATTKKLLLLQYSDDNKNSIF